MNSDQLLKLLKPLYGLSESGDYWHETFFRHLQDDMHMTPTTGDLSFFFKAVHGKLKGVVGTYVDDTLCAGDPVFEKESRITEKKFESKEREYEKFTFAGIQVEPIEDGYLLHQERYAKRLKELPTDCTFSEYRSRRQALSWLTNTRPDICADVNLSTQVTERKWERRHVTELNSVIRYVKRTSKRGLMQRRLDMESLKIKVFSDSSFANAEEKRSQLGFVVLLCDDSGRANVLHYASYKSKRVVRSTMGGEVFAFADGFDYGYSLRHDLERMTGRKIPLLMYTDSDSVFKVIVKNSMTTERQLMIDLEATRQAYGRRGISDIGWVRSADNPADGMTKKGECPSLNKLMDEGTLDAEVLQWVVRADGGKEKRDQSLAFRRLKNPSVDQRDL